MRAVTLRDGDVLVEEHPDPEPGAGEVLVRVRAAGLNGADMMQRRGLYPAPPGAPAEIPGLELAGEVEATGLGADRFSPGDKVMGIVGGGGQAELCVVHERVLMPVPEGARWPEAGGLPEVFTTAHDAVFTQAGLRMGERFLVHGGAGGVGTAAIQLGRMAGAQVTATVRREEARERVAELGCRAMDPESDEEHGPYDVILELVGAPNLPRQPADARHERPDRRDRHRRRRQGRGQPRRADGQARADHGLDAAGAAARGEGDHRAADGAPRAPGVRPRRADASRSPRPSRSTRRRTPTRRSWPAASSASSC